MAIITLADGTIQEVTDLTEDQIRERRRNLSDQIKMFQDEASKLQLELDSLPEVEELESVGHIL